MSCHSCGGEPRRWPRPTIRHLQVTALGIGLVALTACSRGYDALSRYDEKTGTSASPRLVALGEPVPRGGGHFKLGAPYQVSGRWYTPQFDPTYDRVGIASWYGEDFHGRKTANGEIYDMSALTAAHPTLPLPSYAYVTNLANGRTILVRVNDRGPYARDRILDLSWASARALGMANHGLGRVRVRYAGHAPMNGDDSYERRFLWSQPWSRSRYAQR